MKVPDAAGEHPEDARAPLLGTPWPAADPPSHGPWSELEPLIATRPAARDPFRGDPWRRHGFALLDVRSDAAFDTGHVPGSCHVPAGELQARRHELPPRWRPLLLAGREPELSAARAALVERGHAHVHVAAEPPESWPGPSERGPARVAPWEVPPVLHRWVPEGRAAKALDLACGSGRNAVYLACRGWDVLAVDHLDDALDMARALSARWSVDVTTRNMDLTKETPLTPATFDLIVVFRYLERELFGAIAGALRPGGRLIYQTFTTRQARFGRPRNPRFLLNPGELSRAFPGLETLEYAEGRDAAGSEMAVLVARAPREGEPHESEEAARHDPEDNP
jgi:tellurite methyltransferase